MDTNVVSEARKPRGDANVKAWMTSVSGTELYLSVLVVGEIRQGVERLRSRDSEQASEYDVWLAELRRQFSRHILSVTEEVAEEWGRMNVPDPISAIDGLQAATAAVHDLTFVTRNTRDVERTGVRLLNPFESAG
ncbi:MAG TPA: type II toxin-antitoxin system VapC family toxin [Gemmatimonadota bacterium]|nr:type II toxin-antitoxin system VapC family toxin [Gemmatimonadota bacterium]